MGRRFRNAMVNFKSEEDLEIYLKKFTEEIPKLMPEIKQMTTSKYIEFIEGTFEGKATTLFRKYGKFDFVWFDCCFWWNFHYVFSPTFSNPVNPQWRVLIHCQHLFELRHTLHTHKHIVHIFCKYIYIIIATNTFM